MEYLVASFRSRTETIGFYRYLLANGINAEIVNTPKEANVGCGLSVKTNLKNYNYLKKGVLKFKAKSFAGIFLVSFANNRKVVRSV